jgi:hypothetical protein
MPEQPKRPFPLLVCGAMIELGSHLVPSGQRADWKREWQAEIWHRWQFLWHSGSWNNGEAALLLRRCAGAFPDALWHLTGQAEVQARFREWIRSPWTCLGSLVAGLALLAIITGGLPATREAVHTGTSSASSRLVFIWFHPSAGGGDEGLPPDVVPAWAVRSRLLEKVAPFVIGHRVVSAANGHSMQPLVVKTRASLFDVLGVQPSLGRFSQNSGLVLTDSLWKSLFRRDPNVIGKKVRIGREWQQVAAVLPPHFAFLSRQPAAYLVESFLPDAQLMVVGRIKPGVSEKQLDKELTHIAETACYYYFRSELRYSFLNQAAWIPLEIFLLAALASALLLVLASRVSLRRLRVALSPHNRKSLSSRTSFFSAKVALAFLLVLLSALEWSRSQSAVLFGSRDPAAGPFLLWLYILGTMGVLFWAVADQRARCRVCLRLLCFPVRVGCPGCLLLNWSGTELLCSEGHGVLHVPHLAPSWDEESEHWISLDESWRDLFAEAK